uniref:Uncharacterized protein n=1 Tax=Rhizophora mucronata TaxID=61149 RepID=A0A2P2NSL3_RHIMU
MTVATYELMIVPSNLNSGCLLHRC